MKNINFMNFTYTFDGHRNTIEVDLVNYRMKTSHVTNYYSSRLVVKVEHEIRTKYFTDQQNSATAAAYTSDSSAQADASGDSAQSSKNLVLLAALNHDKSCCLGFAGYCNSDETSESFKVCKK